MTNYEGDNDPGRLRTDDRREPLD